MLACVLLLLSGNLAGGTDDHVVAATTGVHRFLCVLSALTHVHNMTTDATAAAPLTPLPAINI